MTTRDGGVCFCCVWASSRFGLFSLSLALALFFFTIIFEDAETGNS